MRDTSHSVFMYYQRYCNYQLADLKNSVHISIQTVNTTGFFFLKALKGALVMSTLMTSPDISAWAWRLQIHKRKPSVKTGGVEFKRCKHLPEGDVQTKKCNQVALWEV